MIKGKISIIGSGFVGSTTAYTIMMSSLVSELVIVDINKDKAVGDAMDLNHGLCFVSQLNIYAGDYKDTENSDMYIITAGAYQNPGESRTDLLGRNAKILRNVIEEISKYCKQDALIMVVSNPVDILTYITYKISGFDKRRVIGSGTVLDTARLKFLISEKTKVDSRNVHTYIIGEHGDSEVATWSMTNIAGMNMDEYCKECGTCEEKNLLCKDELYNKTKNAAYEIIEKKGATYYAVALAVRRILESITGNENSVLTVSSLIEGEYGISDICLSVPTIVNAQGAYRVLEFPFSDEEISNLRKSADTLKSLAGDIGF